MPGLGSVLDIGKWALFASQSSLETTGNNIANVNTPNYSRRKVILEEAPSIDFFPGQLGTGVQAKEVVRIFDDFVEKQYLNKYSDQEKWRILYENLDSVQTLFKNEEDSGVSASLEQFWMSWQNLAQRPDDSSVRTALLGDTNNLIQAVNIVATDLDRVQIQINDSIQQDVNQANKLIQEIADVNRQITAHEIPGKNIPNELYDKRNKLMRDLAQLMDINVIDHGRGDLLITTRSGYTLVDGVEYYRIAFEGPQSFTTLTPSSDFDGQIYFSGSDEYEYTFEVVTEGYVRSDPSASDVARLKISIDGGQSWLTDENGNYITIPALTYDRRISVPNSDIDIWFGDPDDPSQYSGSNPLKVGDSFQIVPKHGLYWYKTSSSKVNITPMIMENGQDNTRRLVGGTLTGAFNFRDNYIGEIKEKFNEFTKELIWEVNRIHSQGAGLTKFGEVTGTYQVNNLNVALGSNSSGLFFYDKLQQGNIEFYIYNNTTGELETGPLFLDMDGDYTDNIRTNFDPSTHSLSDIVDAINNDPRLSAYMSASINDNKLVLKTTDSNYRIAFGQDTTGLLAALGINTFFEGENISNIAINPYVNQNINFISSGRVNGAGETNPGDNTTANSIAELQYKRISFTTKSEGTTFDTLEGYYNSLTAKVGSYTSTAEYNYNFFESLAKDLDARQKEVSGVNLDEEMSNLLKFQQAYTAAAKLITVSEQMMDTLIQMIP
jgi:flagellar hook-associated protein 1 FlgK